MIEDTIAKVYGTIDGSTEWKVALQHVLRATGSERLSIASLGTDGTFRQDSEPFDPDGALLFLRDYADKDLRIQRVMKEGRRGVMSTRDLMSAEEIANCPVHNEFYRLYPECWHATFATLQGESELIIPVIHRRSLRNEFSAEESRALELISPHLARALEMKRILPSSMLSHHDIVAAYDALEDGIVMFDQAGLILHMNRAAREIAEVEDGIAVRQGSLSAIDAQSSQALLQMMTTTIRVAFGQQHELPKPIGVRRRSTKHPLIIRSYIVPTAKDGNRLGVLKLQARLPWFFPEITTIGAAAGLTPSEARLGLALLNGETLKSYARQHDLSEHTVRTHMKHVREKLGVSRQADVVAVLARLCSG